MLMHITGLLPAGEIPSGIVFKTCLFPPGILVTNSEPTHPCAAPAAPQSGPRSKIWLVPRMLLYPTTPHSSSQLGLLSLYGIIVLVVGRQLATWSWKSGEII